MITTANKLKNKAILLLQFVHKCNELNFRKIIDCPEVHCLKWSEDGKQVQIVFIRLSELGEFLRIYYAQGIIVWLYQRLSQLGFEAIYKNKIKRKDLPEIIGFYKKDFTKFNCNENSTFTINLPINPLSLTNPLNVFNTNPPIDPFGCLQYNRFDVPKPCELKRYKSCKKRNVDELCYESSLIRKLNVENRTRSKAFKPRKMSVLRRRRHLYKNLPSKNDKYVINNEAFEQVHAIRHSLDPHNKNHRPPWATIYCAKAENCFKSKSVSECVKEASINEESDSESHQKPKQQSNTKKEARKQESKEAEPKLKPGRKAKPHNFSSNFVQRFGAAYLKYKQSKLDKEKALGRSNSSESSYVIAPLHTHETVDKIFEDSRKQENIDAAVKSIL